MIGIMWFGGSLIYFLLWMPVILILQWVAVTPRGKSIITLLTLINSILITAGNYIARISYHKYLCLTGEPGLQVY